MRAPFSFQLSCAGVLLASLQISACTLITDVDRSLITNETVSPGGDPEDAAVAPDAGPPAPPKPDAATEPDSSVPPLTEAGAPDLDAAVPNMDAGMDAQADVDAAVPPDAAPQLDAATGDAAVVP